MSKEEKNSGAILYFEYAEHFDLLSREDRGDLVTAMLEYGMSGVVTTELSGCARMAFSFIKKQMDRDADKYKEKCEKNAGNGKKGGRPKKENFEKKPNGFFDDEEKPNGFSENPTKPNGDFGKPKKANEKENKKEKENTHSLSECVTQAQACAPACEDTPTPKKAYGKHGNVFLTDEEYADVKSKCAAYLDVFSEKLKRKGYKFDNHYSILTQWASEHGMMNERTLGNFDTDEAFEKAVKKTLKRHEERKQKHDIQNTG